MGLKRTLLIYKELSKAGIVTLVLISVLAGYLIGHSPEKDMSWIRLLVTLTGVLLLASGSSALNQIQERKVDSQMPRTAARPLPAGRMTLQSAWAFVLVTLGSGIAILAYLGPSIVYLGLAAVFSYNVLYTLWWKRKWAFAAVPGAIPGALPILIGFTAAGPSPLDPAGLYLFLVLVFWQMPHFWVLALRFQKDYEKGGFPTLPVVHGQVVTVEQIALWCLAYVGLALIAPLFLSVSWIYMVPTILISGQLLIVLVSFIKNPEGKNWLRFFLWVNVSLIIYLAFASVDLWRHQLFERFL